mmetsp:Transcript_12852/g.30055  ORF Transcript_12852/g.30055 Transcript_12852/m.30055 type:complete len:204 (+) Transcript_12852:706-1317(+)
MSVVLCHDFGRETVELGHGSNRFVHHFLGFRIRHQSLAILAVFQDPIPKPVVAVFFVLFPPFVHVDGNLGSQWFRKHQDISDPSAVGTHVLIARDHRSRNTPDDWPGIQHCLTTRHGSLGLRAGIAKPAHHEVGTDRPFLGRHVPRGCQQHENKIAMLHTLCVQIRQDIGGPNPTLQIRGVHQGEEEIGCTNDEMTTLARFAN